MKNKKLKSKHIKNTYYTFGKTGGLRYLDFPKDAYSYILKDLKRKLKVLESSKYLFTKTLEDYAEMKGIATRLFELKEADKKNEEKWKSFSKELYRMKSKVICLTNQIKELKCNIRQTKILLSSMETIKKQS